MKPKEKDLLKGYQANKIPCMISARICDTCGVGIIIEVPSLSESGIIVDFDKTFQWELDQAGWESYWFFGKKYRCKDCVSRRCKDMIEKL